MKRLLILCCAAVMLLACCISPAALAASETINVSTFEQLKSALGSEDNAGATIRLTADIELTERVKIFYPFVLELNGHTIRDTQPDSMTFWVQSSGSLTIFGDGGKIQKDDHSNNMIYADGEVNVVGGTYCFTPYTWGDKNCPYRANDPNHLTNSQKLGSLFVGRGAEYNGSITIYDGVLDNGIRNPEDVPYIMFPTLNNNEGRPCMIRIYGGTLVSADPRNGDANGPSLYFKGQTQKGVLPEGFELTTGTNAGGFATYTVKYPFGSEFYKEIEGAEVSPVGFRFKLKGTYRADGSTVISSNKEGVMPLSYTAKDVFSEYELSEIKGGNSIVIYDDTVYEVEIASSGKAGEFAPIVQYRLNGEKVDEAVFVNTYIAIPSTGDGSAPLLYAAFVLAGFAALTVLRKKREA